MSKFSIALFKAEIPCVNGKQDALLAVFVPQGEKTYSHILFGITELTDYDDAKRIMIYHESPVLVDNHYVHYCEEFKYLQYNILHNNNEIINDPRIKDKVDIMNTKTKIIEKIDEELLCQSSEAESIKMTDSDYLHQDNTLRKYLEDKFIIDEQVKDLNIKTNSKFWAAKKDPVDWNQTWNSDKLTSEEKAILRQKPDFDIEKYNYNRDCYRIFGKILNTQYSERNYCLIGLHSRPGAGKTKATMNYCALNNIPCLCITCDAQMTIKGLLAEIAPIDRGSTLSSSLSNKLISQYASEITIAQEKIAKGEDLDISTAKLQSALQFLTKVKELSDHKIELNKTYSILYKCLKYQLPLVVFFDEANLMPVQQQNALSPIITDGFVREGEEVFKNNNTIRWVMAWNPDTTGAKSFDGKMYDRMCFIHFEDLDDQIIKEYKGNKKMDELFPDLKEKNMAKLIKRAETIKIEKPELSDKVNKVMKLISKGQQNSSFNGIEWFFEKSLALNNTDVASFTEYYLDNVTLRPMSECLSINRVIVNLWKSVNNELKIITKGIDSKNMNRNSSFYIPNRADEIFCDYILGYGNVEKAIHRFIYDLLPDDTLRNSYSINAANDDNIPEALASSITNKLATIIKEAETKIFTNITEKELIAAQSRLQSNFIYRPEVWIDPMTATVATVETVTAESKQNLSVSNDPDDILTQDIEGMNQI